MNCGKSFIYNNYYLIDIFDTKKKKNLTKTIMITTKLTIMIITILTKITTTTTTKTTSILCHSRLPSH